MLRGLLDRLSRRAVKRLVELGEKAEAEGRFVEACERYRSALRLRPDYAPAHLSLGIALEGAGETRAAREAYLDALRVDPGNPYAHFNLGKLLHAAGNHDEAARQLRAALEKKPDFTDARLVLASVLEHLADAEGTLEMFRQAVAGEPGHAGAWFNYALFLQKIDRIAEAETAMRRTLELWPGRAELWLREAELLKWTQQLPAAEQAARRALEIDAKLSNGYRLLASILNDQLRSDEALEVLRAGRSCDADRYTRACELFMLNFSDRVTTQELFERHREFGAELEAQVPARFDRFVHTPDPERKLRIGFISGDFHAHPVGWTFLPLLQNIDRSRYETVCYSMFEAADDVTRSIAVAATRWQVVTPLSNRELVEQIYTDAIDVLVDLSGYGGLAPFDVLASRAAPVQASWLGYLSTSGMTRIDYRISDAFADPPGIAERFHTEKLIRLPHSQWCYRAPGGGEIPSEAPFRRNGFVTFGSFNQAAKLSPTARRLWAEILKRVPDSRLLIVGVPPGPATQALVAEFQGYGIAPGRVGVEPRLKLEDYFGRLATVDLALDTMPYSGGTTTCDTLWMGTPLVTMSGERSVSRSGASLLAVLGLQEWIATSPEGYVERAVALASDPARLAGARGPALRERMRASPLMDERQFARDMEAVLRQMWREWCAKSGRTVNSS